MQILRVKLKSAQNVNDPVMEVTMMEKVSYYYSLCDRAERELLYGVSVLFNIRLYDLRSSRNS